MTGCRLGAPVAILAVLAACGRITGTAPPYGPLRLSAQVDAGSGTGAWARPTFPADGFRWSRQVPGDESRRDRPVSTRDLDDTPRPDTRPKPPPGLDRLGLPRSDAAGPSAAVAYHRPQPRITTGPFAEIAVPEGFLGPYKMITLKGQGTRSMYFFEVMVGLDGHALLPQPFTASSLPGQVSQRLMARFVRDLQAAGPLDQLPTGACDHRQLAGEPLVIILGRTTSVDLFCTTSPQGQALRDDAVAMLAELDFAPWPITMRPVGGPDRGGPRQ